MRRSLAKVLLVAVALMEAVGVLAVVSETAGESEPATPNLIANSVDLADQAGTSRVAFAFELLGPPEFSFVMRGEGVANHATGDGQVTMTMTLPPGAPAVPGLGEPMEMIVMGTIIYVRVPALASLVGSKPWVSIDLAEMGEELEGLPGLDQIGSGDPAQTLELLRGASDEVTAVGEEVLRDVPTTHYRAELDLTKALDEVSPADRPLVGHQIADFREMFGSTTLPVDVWIDADGLPRQFRIEVPVPAEEGVPEGARVAVTMEMFDFGVPVDVQPPPADQVVDGSAIFGGLG